MLKSKIQKNVTHGTFGKKKFSKERHAHIFFLFSDVGSNPARITLATNYKQRHVDKSLFWSFHKSDF